MKQTAQAQKKITLNGTLLKMVKGDLVLQDVEAIVNAANPLLEGGGGVDGRIHQSAGPDLLEACKQYKQVHGIEKLPVSHAILTDSFEIKKITPTIHYVIHTVGPDCRIGAQWDDRETLLVAAYVNAFNIAREKEVQSLAFPAISTGAFNYPFWEAQMVAVQAVKKYIENKPQGAFKEVRLVYFSDAEFDNALRVWDEIFMNLS